MKILAFYLPQFHEFDENNRFWGKGFTEWTCLQRAKPIYEGHDLRYPANEIGQYCLMDKSVRAYQAKAAKQFGVFGFCYYHYWFGEKAIMDKPLLAMLKDGEPNLPFCFSWANESWTRRMNGGNGEVLIQKKHGDKPEWKRHFDYLLKFFKHPNYIKLNNKPMLLLYRISDIDNYKKRFEFWQEESKKNGFEGIHLVITLGNFTEDYKDICPHVSASVEFFPNFLRSTKVKHQILNNTAIYQAQDVFNYITNHKQVHKIHYRGMLTGFDNSPRSPKISSVITNINPQLFSKTLEIQINRSTEDFLFINAWNEWGEGATLEPDIKFGYGFLKAIKSIKKII